MALTPAELNKMAEGYKQRQRFADERAAYWVSCLMNCQLTTTIKPKNLLDPLYPEEKPVQKFKQEENEFMKQFKEVLKDGNNSQSGRENRRGHK